VATARPYPRTRRFRFVRRSCQLAPRRRRQRSLLGRRLSRVGTTTWVANHTEGRRRVVLAAIIAGMLVLMGIINDIEDGLHDLNETSQK
jgi:hypothetical protein